ncbi:hypothetical protein QIH80_18645 [Bradyrhizobium elkanii]|nr:hypothetical protein QIH80_18645 [Bradyrhizobium elkanii]
MSQKVMHGLGRSLQGVWLKARSDGAFRVDEDAAMRFEQRNQSKNLSLGKPAFAGVVMSQSAKPAV